MLSKAWTAIVATSALFLGVLWLALSVERMGFPTVAGFIALALLIRHRQTAEQTPPACRPDRET